MSNNPERVDQESYRINQISNQKKLHANTVVQTTHFLKKCVIQPLNAVSNNYDEFGENTQNDGESRHHPFKRGAMTFEDYNYSLFNPYILVEQGTKFKPIIET